MPWHNRIQKTEKSKNKIGGRSGEWKKNLWKTHYNFWKSFSINHDLMVQFKTIKLHYCHCFIVVSLQFFFLLLYSSPVPSWSSVLQLRHGSGTPTGTFQSLSSCVHVYWRWCGAQRWRKACPATKAFFLNQQKICFIHAAIRLLHRLLCTFLTYL